MTCVIPSEIRKRLSLSSRITTHYSQIASYAKIHSPRSRFAQSLSANRTQRSTTNKSAYLCNCRFSLLESRAVKTFPSRRFSAGAAWSIYIYVWKCARNSISVSIKIYQSKKYIIPRIRGTLLLQLYSDISKGDSLFLPLKRHDAITRDKNKSTSDHPVCNSRVIRHRFALFFFIRLQYSNTFNQLSSVMRGASSSSSSLIFPRIYDADCWPRSIAER